MKILLEIVLSADVILSVQCREHYVIMLGSYSIYYKQGNNLLASFGVHFLDI